MSHGIRLFLVVRVVLVVLLSCSSCGVLLLVVPDLLVVPLVVRLVVRLVVLVVSRAHTTMTVYYRLRYHRTFISCWSQLQLVQPLQRAPVHGVHIRSGDRAGPGAAAVGHRQHRALVLQPLTPLLDVSSLPSRLPAFSLVLCPRTHVVWHLLG